LNGAESRTTGWEDAMTDESAPRYSYRDAEGMWGKVFASHTFTPILERAEGIYLYDAEGRRYIDVSGGPMAIGIGHGDRRVNEAIARQLEKFAYCHPVLSNRPRAELCERLSRVAPGSLNTTFLTPGGGSDAVETALKLARQYHLTQGRRDKHLIVSHLDSYHGMSLGALAVGGIPGMRNPFAPMLPSWPKIHQYSERERPRDASPEEYAVRVAQELEECIHYNGPQNISAFIATPIGCGSDYGLMPPASYWKTIREICSAHDILLIADEVVSGFGRTGRWFAIEHFGVEPDLMTVGKGITSLYTPLGGVIVSDAVNEPFHNGTYFNHGFTNQGHPVACAASLAVLDILEKDGLIENSAAVGEYLHAQKHQLLEHPTVADVRGSGLLMVMELVADKRTMDFFPRGSRPEFWLQSIGLENGVVFYNTLYGPRRPSMPKRGLPFWIAPPLCITREQVDELLAAVDRTLGDWERKMGL
jgi:adenosylmethionine-8-amino-7-oxononanoate aminotransferase